MDDDFKDMEDLLKKRRDSFVDDLRKENETAKNGNEYYIDRNGTIVYPKGSPSVKVVNEPRNSNNKGRPAKFTTQKGFLNYLKNLSTSRKKSIALTLASVALGATLGAVTLSNLKAHEIDTSTLTTISENYQALNETDLSYSEMKDVITFAENYKALYESKDFSKESLVNAYEEYYRVAGNVIKSKVSNITGINEENICVVARNENHEINYLIVKGHLNDKNLVVVEEVLMHNDEIPSDLLKVVKPYVYAINVNNEGFEGLSDNLKSYAKNLYGGTVNLVNLAEEPLEQGRSFSGIGRKDIKAKDQTPDFEH